MSHETLSLAPGGKRAWRKHLTRRDLIQAARNIFGAKGPYDSRVEEITGRAGTAKGTLYKYFEKKESLILEVVEAAFEGLDRRIDEETPRGRGLAETLDGLVRAHGAYLASNPDLIRIFHQAHGMPGFNRRERGRLRRVLVAHIDRLAARLARVAPEERPSARARRELAVLIFGSVSGTLSAWVSVDPRAGPRRAPPEMARCLAAMAHALASRPGRPARKGPS